MANLLTIWAALVLNSHSLPHFLGVRSPQATIYPPEQSIAMFAGYSDEALVHNSDVILQGELIGQTQVDLADGTCQSVGILRIDEAIKGDTEQTLVLIGLAGSTGILASDSIAYETGQTGLWFLRLKTAFGLKLYWADHPQRFREGERSSEELSQIRSLIP